MAPLPEQGVAGGAAGGVAAAATTPLDVVKTRLQLEGVASRTRYLSLNAVRSLRSNGLHHELELPAGAAGRRTGVVLHARHALTCNMHSSACRDESDRG